MTLPHVDLGNSYQDVGQGANTFASGLMAQRQRQQQLALQEALAQSKTAMDAATTQHLNAQTDQLIPAQAGQANAQTADINAQAAGRDAGNLPADDEDESRLREVDPAAPHGIYRGYNKAQASEHTKTIAGYMAAKQRIAGINDRFYERGALSSDANGNVLIVHPNQANGGNGVPGNPQAVPGAAKPVNASDRKAAGAGQAARSAHMDLSQIENENPSVAQEVAKALALPSIGRLSFIPGTGEGAQQILDAFRLSGASPQAQVYLKRMFDFTGVAGPARYGLRGMQNPRTLQQLWTDFGLGQFNLSHEGILAAQRNRSNAVNQLEETAGPNAWDQSQSVFPQSQTQIGGPSTTSPYGYHKR